MDDRPRVGVFDSGVGGLTVLNACAALLPHVRFFYYGDNRRAPYGSRPAEEIAAFTGEALSFFSRLKVDAAVIACNTATAVCAEEMRGRFPFPVVGTEPAVLPAARTAKDVLVLCTPVTAASPRLFSLMARCPGTRFTVFGAPRLAAAIERLGAGGTVALSSHLPRGSFGAVVLGCTHYSFLKEEIAAFYSAPVFDSGEGVARRLASLLNADFPKKAGEIDHNCTVLNTNISSCDLRDFNIEFVGINKNRNEKRYKQTFIFDKVKNL